MIATRRGLVVLAAIAGALLVVLAIDLARRSAPMDRSLVPGFDETSVVRLGWTAHPVGPYLTLERSKGQPWRRTAPSPGAVEQAPIESLLAALRGARWHRAESRDARDAREHATHLAVEHASGRLELWIGRTDAPSEQAWIGIGDRRYLVDAWVARALVPSPIEVAVRAPLAPIASAPAYTIDGVRIEAWPRRLVPHPSPGATSSLGSLVGSLVLDPAFVAELERALAELAIDAFPPAPMGHGAATPSRSAARPAFAGAITIDMGGTRVSLGGPCEQRVYLAATTGDGCVPRAQADAVAALVEKLRGPRAAIASRAPVPVGVRSVTLVGGATLDLEKRPTIDGVDASDEAVATLMTVLRSPVEPTEVVPAPATSPVGTLALVDERGNDLVLALHRDNLVVRAGESIALRLGSDAFAVLLRGASAYRDPTPWTEEPTMIEQITIDGVTWTRGAVIGEWTRTPAGPSDAASIEALVTALARPRVLGVASGTVAMTRRIELVVRPPVGAAKTHTLEVGAPTVAGCPAKIGATSLLLSVEICRLVPR